MTMPKMEKSATTSASLAPQVDVTIIMAVYNAKNFLRETLDSIVNQETKYTFDLLAINDGSTDNSLEILQEYQLRYPGMIHIINQRNHGYAATLNTGFHQARRSRYLANLDSDDIYSKDFIEKTVSAGDKYGTDVVLTCYDLYNSYAPVGSQHTHYIEPNYNDQHDEHPIPIQKVTVDLMDAPDHVFKVDEFPGLMAKHHSLWAGIWRREFVQDHFLTLPETASAAYQDIPFFAQALTNDPTFCIIKEDLVHYRFEPGQGNSMQARGKKLIQMAVMCRAGYEVLLSGGKIPLLADAMMGHAVVKNRAPYNRIDEEFKDEFVDKLGRLYLDINEHTDFHSNPFLANPGDKEFVVEIIYEYISRHVPRSDDAVTSLKKLHLTAADMEQMKEHAQKAGNDYMLRVLAEV